MKTLLLFLLRFVSTLLFSLLIFLAVLVAIGRPLVQNIDYWHQGIEERLSVLTGTEITFQRIRGGWQRLTPAFTLSEIAVRQPGAEQSFATLDRLHFAIDLSASLRQLRPVIVLDIDGAALELIYQQDRLLITHGPQLWPADTHTDTDWLAWIDQLLSQPRLQLNNSNIQVRGLWAQPVRVSDMNLGLVKRGTQKQLWGNLVLQGKTPIHTQLVAQLNGRLDRRSLQGKVFAKILAPDLASWLPVPIKELSGVDVQTARGSISAWATINKGQLNQLTTRLNLADVLLQRLDNPRQAPPLKSLAAVTRWQGNWFQNWQLAVDQLSLDTGEYSWQPQNLYVKSGLNQAQQRFYFGQVDRFSLAPWLAYLEVFLAPESKAYQLLTRTRPAADLADLRFRVTTVPRQPPEFVATSTLRAVNLSTLKWIPGLNHINARIMLSDKVSVLDLQGQDVEMNYPALFRKPLTLDQAQGALVIYNQPEQLRIESGLLAVNDQHISGVAQLTVEQPWQADAIPYVRIQAAIDETDASFLPDFLPAGILPSGLVRWLDEAVKSGTLLRGDLLFHGPADFDQAEPFQYQLGFLTEQVSLAFLPDWRALQDLSAEILVDDGALDIQLFSGRYYGAKLKQGRVYTQSRDQGVELRIQADLSGALSEALQILVDAPISKRTAPIMRQLTARGRGYAHLDIRLPFVDEQVGELDLNINTWVKNARLRLKQADLDIRHLNGGIVFDTKRGLSSQGLKGQLLGGPVSASIKTLANRDAEQIVIRSRGKVDLEPVKDWLQLAFLQPVTGNLDYQAKLHFNTSKAGNNGERNYLEIRSDLSGVELNYPAPLAKTRSEALPFRFTMTLEGKETLYEASLEDRVEFRAAAVTKKIQRASLGFQRSVSLPSESGLVVRGNIDSLSVDSWLQRLSGLSAGINDSAATSKDKNPLSALAWLKDSKLRIENLQLGHENFTGLNLSYHVGESARELKIKSSQVDGFMQVPGAYFSDQDYKQLTAPLTVSVNHLHLAPAATANQVKAKPSVSMRPGDLPPINISIQQLQFKQRNLGRWQLETRPVAEGLNLKLAATTPHLRITGQGGWYNGRAAQPASTRLKTQTRAADIAEVLQAFHYAPSITSEEAVLDVDAHWPGSPFEFALQQTNADINMVMKSGRIRDLNSGAADKMLAWLNFDDWLSRMQLKFKDLESKEMPYQVIRGSFTLADYRLQANQLQLDASAIDANLQGTLNLQNHEIDATMDVAIPMTRSLVLPAAATGNLPVAAGIYLLEKLIGSQLNKLTTIKYSLSGNIEKPRIALEESFNIIPANIEKSLISGDNSKPANKQPLEPANQADEY